MKKCSIVYVGFKTGFKFIEGKFDCNKPIPINSCNELEKLTADFKLNNNIDGCNDITFDILAKQFLKNNGWKVVYSDYNPVEINESMSESEAEKFIKKAKLGEVKFKYKKVEDNSIRKARGTLKKDIIDHGLKSLQKAKKSRNIPNTILIYWDLDKNMFRCFRKSNFISYINN